MSPDDTNVQPTDQMLTLFTLLVSLCTIAVLLVGCAFFSRRRKSRQTRRISYTNKAYDDVEASDSALIPGKATLTPGAKAPVKPKRSHSTREKVLGPTANYENVFLDVYRGNFSVSRLGNQTHGSVSDAETSDIPFIDSSKEDVSQSNGTTDQHVSEAEEQKVSYETECDRALEQDVTEHTTES